MSACRITSALPCFAAGSQSEAKPILPQEKKEKPKQKEKEQAQEREGERQREMNTVQCIKSMKAWYEAVIQSVSRKRDRNGEGAAMPNAFSRSDYPMCAVLSGDTPSDY